MLPSTPPLIEANSFAVGTVFHSSPYPYGLQHTSFAWSRRGQQPTHCSRGRHGRQVHAKSDLFPPARDAPLVHERPHHARVIQQLQVIGADRPRRDAWPTGILGYVASGSRSTRRISRRLRRRALDRMDQAFVLLSHHEEDSGAAYAAHALADCCLLGVIGTLTQSRHLFICCRWRHSCCSLSG